MRGPHLVGPEAETLDRLGTKVGHEHVGGREQPLHRVAALVGLEVERRR